MTKDEIRQLLTEADALNTEPEAGADISWDLRRKSEALHRLITVLIDLAGQLNERDDNT